MKQRIISSLVVLLFCFSSTLLQGQAVTLEEKGIILDDGAKGKFTLQYPKLADSAKKRNSISKTALSDDRKKAELEYAGGGKATIELGDGEVRYTFSEVPEDTKQIYSRLEFPISVGEGGKYTLGKDGEFPKEKDKVTLAQGNVELFQVTTAAGGKITLQIEPRSYQQLQDAREYKSNNFLWQGWMPYEAERNQYVIKFVAAAESSKKPSAPVTPPAQATTTMENKSPEPVVDSTSGTSIQKWKNAKRLGFYLAFDDACPTHLINVIPELQKRKMVGTFYVIAGSGNFKDKPKWLEAAKSPYVVLANHTYNHKDFPTIEKFEEEVIETNKSLDRVQPGKSPRLISFGKPGGVKYGITDAQIGEVLTKHNLLNRLSFWGGGIHVKGPTAFTSYVNAAVKKGEISHLDFHGVGGDWLPVSMQEFEAFLDALDANSELIWISDAATVQKYAAQRKAATVNVIENSAEKIRVELKCSLDPQLYDAPLTLATKVPRGVEENACRAGRCQVHRFR